MAFYIFFSTLFSSDESFSVLSDDNMCSTVRDSHPLKSTYKPTPVPFLLLWSLRSFYIHNFFPSLCFQMHSHHCHIALRALQAIKG